jgi:hypothetical protein
MGETTMRLARVTDPIASGEKRLAGVEEVIASFGCEGEGSVAKRALTGDRSEAWPQIKEASRGTKPLSQVADEGRLVFASVGTLLPKVHGKLPTLYYILAGSRQAINILGLGCGYVKKNPQGRGWRPERSCSGLARSDWHYEKCGGVSGRGYLPALSSRSSFAR